MIVFGFLLLTILLVGSSIVWLLTIPSGIIKGPGPRDTLGSMLTAGLILTGIVAVSLFGVIKLYPYVAAPNRFTPSYGQLPAAFTGQPFEVRFLRPRFSRTFRGKGTLRFEPNQLVIDGTLEPSALFQLGIVLIVTVVPLIVFRIGVGIIPALLLAFFIGKKKLVHSVSYADMRELKVAGCRLDFSCPGTKPSKVALYVSQVDGERLYRELALRFPAALNGWTAS